MRRQAPERGAIYHVNFSPAAGREQAGPHYAVVISTREYNLTVGLVYVAPVTTAGTASRAAGLAVSLSGAGTKVTGVVQCDQIKALDLSGRGAKPTGEFVPDFIMEEVLAKLAAIFQ